MTTVTMYDAVNPAMLPTDGAIYAAYMDGDSINVVPVEARFPHTPILTIDVTGGGTAQALDVENGDATVPDIEPWLEHDAVHGPVFTKPVVYMELSTAQDAYPKEHPAGFLLWTAHWTQEPHICGPDTCGGLPYPADLTQWGMVRGAYDTSAVNAANLAVPPDFPLNQKGVVHSLTTGGYAGVTSDDGGKTWRFT